jgi:hypothetical protein
MRVLQTAPGCAPHPPSALQPPQRLAPALQHRRRHLTVSALFPCGYILCPALGLLLVTLVAGGLEAMGQRRVLDFWRE